MDILDKICLEAPVAEKFYRPLESDEKFEEKRNQARSRALIHLYLKVQFWLTDFKERLAYVTDWLWDWGIDGYFIDEENEIVHIIQTKFRVWEDNFTEKKIDPEELLNIEIKRILKWEKHDESWTEYNWKILWFQRKISILKNGYSYNTAIVSNISDKITDADIEKLLWWFKSKIIRFNFEEIYTNLVFPVITWTYFKWEALTLEINLKDVCGEKDHIDYSAILEDKSVGVMIMYVPTLEIWKALYKYKNSILEYNPRSYLEMKSWDVNREIYDSMVMNRYNEFALYNNWITILCSNANFNGLTWKKHSWILQITKPQIINGWQTSFTLSRIYEKCENNELNQNVFEGKYVLIKVIKDIDLPSDKNIIEKISRATNNQSYVKDADRKSNDVMQIQIQKDIYDKYWLFYERKTGEFTDWLKEGYIDKDLIVKREAFLKMALCTQFPNENIWKSKISFKNPKNTTESWLFSDDIFNGIFHKDFFDLSKSMYNYFLFLEIKEFKKEQRKDKKDKDWFSKYWNALRYGEIGLILIIFSSHYKEGFKKEDIRLNLIDIIWKWKQFESYAEEQNTNSKYFNKELKISDFYQYYKSDGFISDLRSFFVNKPIKKP